MDSHFIYHNKHEHLENSIIAWVCMYVFMYVCVYVNDVYVCVLCMYLCVCIYVRMNFCMYVRMYVCKYERVSICVYVCLRMCECMYVYICIMYVSIYLYMHVRKCVYVCMYVHMWELTQPTHKSTPAPLGRQAVTHYYCTSTPIYIPAFSLSCCPYRLYSHVTALITVPMEWRKSYRKYDEMSDANLVVAHRFLLGSIPSKPWKQKTNVPNNVVEYPEVFMIHF